MLGKSLSASIVGIDAKIIQIEVDTIQAQLPGFIIVGLPDKAVQEAKERITSAIKNSGYEWPRKKVIVNLAPADIPKTGTSLDLPIAMAILLASDQVAFEPNNNLFCGELSLDGMLRDISGSLSTALECRAKSIQNLFLPINNVEEAALIKGIHAYGCASLRDVVQHLSNDKKLLATSVNFEQKLKFQNYDINFDHIRGQDFVKRAAIIAAAGGHNLLLSGSPGSGKTLISRALPSILPKLTFDEALEITQIYSVAGLLRKDSSIIVSRPFRAPHHTASTTSIIGGGKFPKPGELSLAHRGILFLDEFTEFSSFTVEGLRQPLEDKKVVISRISGTLTFPANFMLVAAMNPCKCGWKGDIERECTCTPFVIEKYKRKVSGPIMDRMDLQVSVNRVKLEDLAKNHQSSQPLITESMRNHVQRARDIQLKRYLESGIFSNSELSQKQLEKYCVMHADAKELLLKAASKLELSARSYFRIIKISRTIADLEQSNVICKNHIAEALQYRINE